MGPVAPRGTTAARLLATTTAVLTVLAVALLGLVAGSAAPAHADDVGLRVDIDDVSPAVLQTDDTLVVTGRVVNTTAEEVGRPQVRLLMQRHVPAGTDALAEWFDGTSVLNVRALTGWNLVASEDPLPVGGSVPFRIELPTTGTFDQFSAWGPRGIEVQASAGAPAFATARTTLLWYPGGPDAPSPVEQTMLAPLTPTAQEWRTALSEQLPVGEVAAERLLAVLDAVGPTTSLAVDPVLLESRAPGAVSTADLGAAAPGPGTAQAELIARLAQTDNRRDLIGLAYADADLAAIAAVDVSAAAEDDGAQLWRSGVDRGRMLFAEAGLTVENVTWPAGELTSAGVDLLAASDTEAVVIDSGAVAATEAAPTLARVTTDRGTVEALVADERLGSALVSPAAGSGAAARQATLALSAVLMRELPITAGGVLVVLPRDLGAGDLEETASRVEALTSAPWLETTNMRSLLGRTGTGGVTLDLPQDPGPDGGLSPSVVREVADGQALVTAYGEAAGGVLVDAYAPMLLGTLSATFAGQADVRSAMLDAATASMAELAGSIRIAPGSDVLLISEASAMPVTLTNDLPVPADVYVELAPQQSWLQARQVPVETLAPGESTTVRIPITAVANGNVNVEVHVLPEAGGRDLAEPATFAVRVRADWETIGTAVVAGLLTIAFVIGLVRTIRRGGRKATT